MKEISKKQLMNQIVESKSEINEMAYRPGREDTNPWDETRDERRAAGKDPNYFERDSAAAAYNFVRQPAKLAKDERKTPPDIWVYRDPFNEFKKNVVVVNDDLTVITEEQLKEENPKFYAWATSRGKLSFIKMKRKAMFDPLEATKSPQNTSKAAMMYRQQAGLEFPAKEATRFETEQTKILKNILYKPLREIQDELNAHLQSIGLPPIQIPDQEYKDQKENIDNYGTISNTNVSWETQNTYFYETVPKYIKNAKDLYFGRPVEEPHLTHLPRQYNPDARWSPTRKTEKTSQQYKADPLTPKLKLNKQGRAADEFDFEINAIFNIRGTVTAAGENQSAFKWTIQYKTQIGKKLREESRIVGGLVDDKFLEAESVTGPLDRLVGSDGSIASNNQIKEAFIEAVNEIKAKILALDTDKQELRLRFAGAGRTDATLQLNESIKVDSIVNKIIEELKQ
jgi:hypothetical protein